MKPEIIHIPSREEWLDPSSYCAEGLQLGYGRRTGSRPSGRTLLHGSGGPRFDPCREPHDYHWSRHDEEGVSEYLDELRASARKWGQRITLFCYAVAVLTACYFAWEFAR